MQTFVHRCHFLEKWRAQGCIGLAANASRRLLCVAREDGTLEIWRNAPSLSLEKVLPSLSVVPQTHRKCVWKDDETFFTAGWSKRVYQWSVHSLDPVAVSDSYGGAVWDLCMSADKSTMVAACEDGTLRVFDLSSGSLVYRRAVASANCRILCCAFHPSQHVVAFGDMRGRMEVWDIGRGVQLSRVKVSGGNVEASVEVIAFVEDGVVVTGDFIGYTQFWDVSTQTLLHSYRSHTACIQALVVAPGPTLFVAGMDPKVVRFAKMYNQWSPQLHSFCHEHPVTGLDYSDRTLISCSLDGSFGLYGMTSFSQKPPVPLLPYVSCRPTVSMSSALSRILCCRLTHSVQLWRLGKAGGGGGQARTTGDHMALAKSHMPLVEIHPTLKLALDFAEISSNGELVVLGTREGVRAYSVEGGAKGVVNVSSKELPESLADLAAVTVALGPSDQWLVLADYHGVLHTYTLPEFERRPSIVTHRGRHVSRLVVRSGLVLSVDSANVVALHNLETGATQHILPPFELPISAIAFHPTQTWLLIASVSDRVYVFDYVKGQHTPWSANVGDRIVTHSSKSRSSIILGFAPTSHRLLFWGADFISSVNLGDSTYDDSSTKKKGSGGGKDRVQFLEGFRHIVGVVALSDKELVVVECPWKEVLERLPEKPVYKHRYVM